MSNKLHTTAMCATQNLPAPSGAVGVPEWVHLLPAVSGDIQTGDKRGPYHVSDANAVIAASFEIADKLPIDENHATDLAAPKGLPAPARGWIVEMQAREDGIWGRVEWTEDGEELVGGRAYRGISPVITHTKDKAKRVISILRASLVNKPNLRGLAALNQETEMTFSERLAELLGLAADASEDQIADAVTSLNAREGGDGDLVALQSQMSDVGVALGLPENSAGATVLAAARAAGDGEQSITALQSELTKVSTELNALKGATATDKATTFVDGAIAEGRVGVKPLRDHYIAMHQEDPARVEKEIAALPVLGGAILTDAPPSVDGEISLNAEQVQAAALLGIPVEDYQKTLEQEAR